MYGGAALNAAHALIRTLDTADRRRRPPGRAAAPGHHPALGTGARGLEAAARRRRRARRARAPAPPTRLPPRSSTSARPPSPRSTSTGSSRGSPHLEKTVLPVRAVANVSVRLAPGQQPDVIAAAFEQLIRGRRARRAPSSTCGACRRRGPGSCLRTRRAIRLGQDAFERVLGVRPALIRSGGTLPIVAALADRRHPDDHHGLLAAGREHPRAEREHPGALHPARDRDRQGAVRRSSASSERGMRPAGRMAYPTVAARHH